MTLLPARHRRMAKHRQGQHADQQRQPLFPSLTFVGLWARACRCASSAEAVSRPRQEVRSHRGWRSPAPAAAVALPRLPAATHQLRSFSVPHPLHGKLLPVPSPPQHLGGHLPRTTRRKRKRRSKRRLDGCEPLPLLASYSDNCDENKRMPPTLPATGSVALRVSMPVSLLHARAAAPWL